MITKACIPLPLQIVIDDVGWFTGRDGHEQNQTLPHTASTAITSRKTTSRSCTLAAA